ncbi:hypothetical protein Tco_1417753 [Tanacetum coccineum]
MEPMNVQFDELTQMASEQHGSGPELQGLTSGHISSGLVQNQAASTSAKPPIKNDWDLLFQPIFDEYFKPPSVVSTTISAATLPPPDTISASSSNSIDQDAPFPSTSPNNETTTSQINSTNVEEPNNEEDAVFDIKEEPKNYKEAMKESSWIEAMQDEIHDFKRLEVWELVPRLDKVMIINLKWIFKVKLDEYDGVLKNKAQRVICTDGREDCFPQWHSQRISIPYPRGILINQSKYALEMLKKYGLDLCDHVDIPMVERLKLDDDPKGTPVDPNYYRGKAYRKALTAVKRVFRYLKGTINMGLWYPKDIGFDLTAFADADHAGCQDSRKSTSGSAQFLGEKLVSWSSKKQKCTAISTTKAEYSTIALSCNIVQHSRMKHIVVRYHFIKEQVKNEIVELCFVKTSYQLVDIFTKALAIERFKFLVKRLGMHSITLEELKHLAETEEDEE